MGLLLRAIVRGSRFRPIEEERMGPRERARVDLCFSASKGLVAVDTPRGGYLALRGLLFALRAGEPRRIGRSLAMVAGAVLAPAGGPLLGWARRMVSRTEALARTFDDDYLRAISDITRGQIAVFEGKWRDALERSERGIETLTLRCRGVTWEANTGETGALRGLEELGRYEALLERAGEHAKRSADRGDLYGEIVAAAYLSIGLLAEGRPSEARAQHRAVFRRWRHGRFDVQSLYALRADVLADIYEGRPEVAYEKVASAWPEIEAALLLRVPVTRIDALLLRARSAIECAVEGMGEVDALLGSAERDARRLARESRLDARAHAAALRAGVHRCRGESDDMQRELDRAEALYDEEGMVVDAICVRVWRRGRIEADQTEELRQRGIHDPARWVRLIAAGFRPEGSGAVRDRAHAPRSRSRTPSRAQHDPAGARSSRD
jgi:ATP/maltotriose-dependent transcriptional regulator MalT